MTERRPPDRRTFLRVIGACAAAAAAPACASSTSAGGGGGGGGQGGQAASTVTSVASGVGGSCGPGLVNVGLATQYTTTGLHTVFGTNVLVGLDEGGFYALTSICTHRGCDMNFDGKVLGAGIECLCHGSVFLDDGSVLLGPAAAPLVAFAMSIECGTLFVDATQIVPSAQRLAV